LDTAIRCAERGRLDAFFPVREEGDAAFAGTSAHAAFEAYLGGHINVDAIEEFARDFARQGAVNGVTQDDGTVLPITYKSFSGADEMIYHAGNCARGWVQDILPVLQSRGEFLGDQEVKFEFEAFEHRGWTVIFQGTVDHVPHYGNVLWDWKTSGSDYKQKDKQMFAVQPSVYGAAAVNGCFGREFALPIDFYYGVCIRLATKARGQIVHVRRTQGHIDWLYRKARTFVNLFMDVGPDNEWPTDEEHFLCSQKWCPWYEQCRGAHLAREDDTFGYTPK
jgi:hypothetical protein